MGDKRGTKGEAGNKYAVPLFIDRVNEEIMAQAKKFDRLLVISIDK